MDIISWLIQIRCKRAFLSNNKYDVMSKLRQIHDRKDIVLFEFVTYFLRFITVFDEI